MKMFMPAARRPTVFVPCCKCTNLHIRLDEVYAGSTIFCSAFDDDLQLPLDYYSELLGSPTGNWIVDSYISKCCCLMVQLCYVQMPLIFINLF